jgi:hypothetical protein
MGLLQTTNDNYLHNTTNNSSHYSHDKTRRQTTITTMKIALTCHRTTELSGKKETTCLGDGEIYPLVDGVEIVVKELRTLLRDCCCPRARARKSCSNCIAYNNNNINI